MAANRIHIKGNYRQEEAIAGAVGIYPGMLVKLNSSGYIVVHSTESGWAEKAFAVEDALQGNTVSTVYTSAAIATYLIAQRGSVVQALLAADKAYTIGMQLISAGDGTLKDVAEASGAVAEVIAVVEVAVDLSASGAVDALGKVRIL